MFFMKKIAVIYTSLVLAAVPSAYGNEKCKGLYEIACGTNGLDKFCEWIQTTELESLFTGQESLTVFAPINEAINTVGSINQIEFLREIVLFSIHDGAMYLDDMHCGYGTGKNLLRMASGKDSRTICEDHYPVFQKGGGNTDELRPRIVSSDIEACNGVIHMVDTVLLPGGFEEDIAEDQNFETESSFLSEGARLQTSCWYAIAALMLFMYQ